MTQDRLRKRSTHQNIDAMAQQRCGTKRDAQ
jgi:hypothetical protein